MKKKNEEVKLEENTQQPVLLEQQDAAIEQIKQVANSDVHILNQLHKKREIAGVDEFRNVIKNSEKICFDEILKRSPEAKRMVDAGFDLKKLPFNKPLEVLELESLLRTASKDNILKYALFDKEANQWVVNDGLLNSDIKRLQKWAETESEILRYHAAKALCDFIENELKPGNYARQRLANEMISLSRGKFIPSVFFVKQANYKH